MRLGTGGQIMRRRRKEGNPYKSQIKFTAGADKREFLTRLRNPLLHIGRAVFRFPIPGEGESVLAQLSCTVPSAQ